MHLRRRHVNPRRSTQREFLGALVDFLKLRRRQVKQTSLNCLGLTRWQTAEIQNAMAVTWAAVVVGAFAFRNGLLCAAPLEPTCSELDVDEFIWASSFLSISTALLAQQYHGPVRSGRFGDDEETDFFT